MVEAACEGDHLDVEIVECTATYLGLGLVNLLHVFLPDGGIFTGGVMRSFDLYKVRMSEIIDQHAVVNPLDQIPLLMTQLSPHAGIYGAARAAMLKAGY